jgi:hypothetical protein
MRSLEADTRERPSGEKVTVLICDVCLLKLARTRFRTTSHTYTYMNGTDGKSARERTLIRLSDAAVARSRPSGLKSTLHMVKESLM